MSQTCRFGTPTGARGGGVADAGGACGVGGAGRGRVPARPARARAVPDAGRRHLLAHLRDAEARAHTGTLYCILYCCYAPTTVLVLVLVLYHSPTLSC